MPGAYGVWWNSQIATTWIPGINTPAREVHTLNPAYMYKYRTWTQNDYIASNYWAGTPSKQINNYGMAASISWANPYLNNYDSVEWVMSNDTEIFTANSNWIQAGWRKRFGQQGPKLWVQYKGPGTGGVQNRFGGEFIPSPTVITAKTYYDSNTDLWYGVARAPGLATLEVATAVSDLGFTQAPYLTAAGETWNVNDQIASTGWQQAVKITDMRYYQTPNRGNATYTNFKDNDYFSLSQPFRYGYDPGPAGTNIAYNFSNWSNFGP